MPKKPERVLFDVFSPTEMRDMERSAGSVRDQLIIALAATGIWLGELLGRRPRT